MDMQGTTETIAEFLHEAWMLWAKGAKNSVVEEIWEHWSKSFVPYNELPEKAKDDDRIMAAKLMKRIYG